MEFVASYLALITYPQIDPVIVSIGPLAIHWYGVAYVAGILLGWRYGRLILARDHLWPANTPPMSLPRFDDFLVWAAIGIIAGGRIGYILFYDFAAIAADPIRAVQIWNGGMSFHGGFLGTFIAMMLFARIHKIPAFSLFDIICAVVPIGLFFGRIANFINGELWGAPTMVPWAMVFPDAGPMPRHPSQLYEALLEGILLFIVLRIATHHFKMLGRPRFVGGLFLFGYGCSRIFVEFFRMPDVQLGYLYGGWFTMGMLLSVPMLIIGIWAMATARPRAYEPQPVEDDQAGAAGP